MDVGVDQTTVRCLFMCLEGTDVQGRCEDGQPKEFLENGPREGFLKRYSVFLRRNAEGKGRRKKVEISRSVCLCVWRVRWSKGDVKTDNPNNAIKVEPGKVS